MKKTNFIGKGVSITNNENPTLIIIQVLLETFLDTVYGVTVNDFYLHSNSRCKNISLFDDVWKMVLIQLEILPQNLPSY